MTEPSQPERAGAIDQCSFGGSAGSVSSTCRERLWHVAHEICGGSSSLMALNLAFVSITARSIVRDASLRFLSSDAKSKVERGFPTWPTWQNTQSTFSTVFHVFMIFITSSTDMSFGRTVRFLISVGFQFSSPEAVAACGGEAGSDCCAMSVAADTATMATR